MKSMLFAPAVLACIFCNCSSVKRCGDFLAVYDFRYAKGNYSLISPFFNIGESGTYRFNAVEIPDPILPGGIDFSCNRYRDENPHCREQLHLRIVVLDKAGKAIAQSDMKGEDRVIEYKTRKAVGETPFNVNAFPDSMRNYSIVVKVIHPSTFRDDEARLRYFFIK